MRAGDIRIAIARGDPPPSTLSAPLLALWWDRAGEWERAHAIVAEGEGGDAAWVHAYLHRKEGDEGNARYWYARADRPPRSGDLDAEWDEIATAIPTSAP